MVNESLKKDSEREVREVKGVTEVLNKIAIAPNLPLDTVKDLGARRTD